MVTAPAPPEIEMPLPREDMISPPPLIETGAVALSREMATASLADRNQTLRMVSGPSGELATRPAAPSARMVQPATKLSPAAETGPRIDGPGPSAAGNGGA